MAVSTYTKSGTKASTPTKLDKVVFGVSVKNHQLLKDAYLAYLAGRRTNLAKAKKRGEVRGGGQKPWRQKGTGRARFGSSRNPIWTGGGVAFGPTGSENYVRKLNTSSKRTAMRQALSMAAAEDRLKVIEDLDSTDGKVKPFLTLLNKLDTKGKTLLIVDTKNALLDRATRNIVGVKLISASYLSVFHIMNADSVVITKGALDKLSQRLGDKKVKAGKSDQLQVSLAKEAK